MQSPLEYQITIAKLTPVMLYKLHGLLLCAIIHVRSDGNPQILFFSLYLYFISFTS
jgi:hypothetical protein